LRPEQPLQVHGNGYGYPFYWHDYESFTVNVDDCGEPGTSDRFGITTTSYSNGPKTLIAGNIQIHK
jgi:hypothetical protein